MKTKVKKTVSTVKGTPLSKIAASLKMDTKNARARMRRLTVPKGMTVGDGWVFTSKGATWAKTQLKTDHRKSA
jgi:hypothetical protein